MYVSQIRLKNIRRFKDLTLEFYERSSSPRTPRMSTLVIGKNATCKSTLLRSVVIGLIDRAEGNALLAEEAVDLVGDKKKPARITIQVSSGGQEVVEIVTNLECRDGHDEVVEQTPPSFESPFLCAYGVSRSNSGPRESKYRVANSTYTLFKYDSYLIEPELALRRLKDYLKTKLYERTMRGLKHAAGLGPADEIAVNRGGGVVIRNKQGEIPLNAWADGHRVPFNLVLDVYAWAMQADAVQQNGSIKGILLIDELGQNLHPSLQIDVLKRFQQLFREIQLIATSHSPIVALGTQPAELVALRAKRKYVTEIQNLPDYSAASAEDILVDERLFDTPAYSPYRQKLIALDDSLRRIPRSRRSAAQKAELARLARELRADVGATPGEDAVVAELRRIRQSLGN